MVTKIFQKRKSRDEQSKERTLSGTHSNYRKLIQKYRVYVYVSYLKMDKILSGLANRIYEEKVKQAVIMSSVGKRSGDFSVMKS